MSGHCVSFLWILNYYSEKVLYNIIWTAYCSFAETFQRSSYSDCKHNTLQIVIIICIYYYTLRIGHTRMLFLLMMNNWLACTVSYELYISLFICYNLSVSRYSLLSGHAHNACLFTCICIMEWSFLFLCVLNYQCLVTLSWVVMLAVLVLYIICLDVFVCMHGVKL